MAAFVVLLVATDVIYWEIAAARLRDGVRAWMEALRAEGWEVRAGTFATSGWPRSATVTIPDLSLSHAGPDIPGKVSVAATAVTTAVSLYNPTTLQIGLTGSQHIQVGDNPEVIVDSDAMGLSVGLVEQATSPVTLFAKSLRAAPASGAWQLTVGQINANAEVTPTAAESEPAVSFALNTEAIALPAIVKWPLGPNISSLSLDGALNGPLPVERGFRQWAEAWRDAGGALEISHLALGWGPLGLTSTATLALDDQLQPMGSGGSRVVGYAETLDRLAASGVLSRSAATAAKAILSLLAGTGMAGGGDTPPPSTVEVPLTLQYRTLSMRQVPLIRLPELDWPDR